MTYLAPPIPASFIRRRAHSLTGLWLVLFLIEHLFTNSQAALFIGDDGHGFVTAVNSLKSLPYLPLIEIFLLGVPLLVHGIWGIQYLFTAKFNSYATDGSAPALTQYTRNRAYTWQRITSWILLFGILAHVIQMRFLDYPSSAELGVNHFYMNKVSEDNGLYLLSKRLGFEIYSAQKIASIKNELIHMPAQPAVNENDTEAMITAQKQREQLAWMDALTAFSVDSNQVVVVSPNFGTAELLMVRDTFKSPLMILLYSGLIIAACFHAFNGLWTCMIRWGITLTVRSQILMQKIAVFLMILIAFMGLFTVWGTYWLNLKS